MTTASPLGSLNRSTAADFEHTKSLPKRSIAASYGQAIVKTDFITHLKAFLGEERGFETSIAD